jgi:pimeloyl-ACP methyl ester carboxylesterase
VLHGEDDPVIRIEGGRAIGAAIPEAKLVSFPGMGHDLPRPLWPTIISEIRALADRGRDARR